MNAGKLDRRRVGLRQWCRETGPAACGSASVVSSSVDQQVGAGVVQRCTRSGSRALSSFFVAAAVLPGDFNCEVLAFRSVPGEVSASAPIPSELPARLEPHGGTLSTDKAASSEFALGACPAPSDWCAVVKMGDNVVVVFLFDAFTRDELLARRLAGRVAGRNATSACESSVGRALLLSRSSFV